MTSSMCIYRHSIMIAFVASLCLIASACPTGSNVAVYAQLHNKDYPYAVVAVAFTIILSAVTIPVIVNIAGCLW